MLTVKVWAEMLATPNVADPVPKLRRTPPASNEIWEWAGQYWSGTHCTTSELSHSNRPVLGAGEVTTMERSAASRSATGPVNVTTIGCATPTVWPLMGRTEATVATPDDEVTAARLAGAEHVIATTTMPAAASARRSALAMVPVPSVINLCRSTANYQCKCRRTAAAQSGGIGAA